MVRLNNISKYYPIRNGRKRVLSDVSFTLEKGEKLGILGCNGAGKSTLIGIIGGAELPSAGTIDRGMSISWPLAFTGGFSGLLSGLDNLRFICRVYGVDFQAAKRKVEDFSELGAYLREPVGRYSSGMRARLAFAISLTVDFDCYLIDEISAVGDKRFNERCKSEFFDKRNDRSIIMVSHFHGVLNEYCNRLAVLDQGRLTLFDDMARAVAHYDDVLAGKHITF